MRSSDTTFNEPILEAERAIAQPITRQSPKHWSSNIKEATNILVTSLPLLGAIGTGFVWVMITFYVGTVDIRPDKAFKSIDVCTYDSKGTEFHFRSPRFQLMPGDYTMLVSCDQSPGRLFGAHVNFRETTMVTVAQADDGEVKSENKSETGSQPEPERHKRWWQFWRAK